MRVIRPVLFVALCVLVQGCGGGADSGPSKLVPFSGTVSLDGETRPGVIITFLAEKGSKDTGAGAFGITDDAGKFTLKYRGEKDGVPPGTYKVVFSHLVLPDGSPIPPGSSAADAGAVEGITPRYTSFEETPTLVVVSESGGTQDFQLKGALRKKK